MLDKRMETQEESDLIKFLKVILRDGIFEIHDFDDPDVVTARTVAQALSLRLIRDDSTGWDSGARYVLTNDGRRALGLRTDWWIPEELRGEISPATEVAGYTKETEARANGLMIATGGRSRHGRTLRVVARFMPVLCLIVVLCCIVLSLQVGRPTSRPPLSISSSSPSEGY